MVLGTVVTALPTTVLAAETKTVTLLGVDGTTELATGSYSVDSVINLVEITGLDYKDESGKFLTFVDGEGKIYGADYTVITDATLTATYQTVHHLYSADDIAALATTQIEVKDSTAEKVTGTDGISYYRINSTTAPAGFGVLFGESNTFDVSTAGATRLEAITDYVGSNKISLQFYTANNTSNRKTFSFHTSGYYTSLDNGTYSISTVFPHSGYPDATNTKSFGYRLGPWGFLSTDKAGRYFDIKYIASFEDEDIAAVFDFDRYMGLVVEEDPALTVTIKDVDGEDIATVEAEIDATVDLLEETGLDYKNEDGKFLAFVNEEGEIFGTTYTMTSDSVTLTATYQNVYGFFSGADLRALDSSRFDTENKMLIDTPSPNENYFRITSLASGTAGGVAIFLADGDEFVTDKTKGVTVIDAVSDYVTASPKITLQLLSVANDASSNSRQTVSYHESGYYTADNGVYYINDLIFPHTSYTKSTTVYGYRIGPWGFNTTGSTAHYFDINYIASFDSADIATLFDFDKYMGSEDSEGGEGGEGGDDPVLPPETPVEGVVEIRNTDGSAIKTLESDVGDVLDLLEESGLDYVDENGKFLSFVDSNGNVFGTEYTVSDGVILTATYQSLYGYYSASDISALPTSQTKLTNFTGSTVQRNGETFYRLTQTTNNTNVFAIYFPSGYTFKPSADSVTVIDASTDFQNIGRTFLQYYYAFQDDNAKTNTTCEYTSNIVKLGDDGRYHLVNPFTFTNFLAQNKTDVYGYRFAPFGGWGTTDAKYTFDIKFIATFDSAEIAKAFDYDKYNNIMLQSQTFDVKLKDVNGKTLTLEDVPYGTYVTPEDINENKPYGFVTQYFEGDKLYVISNWTSGDASIDLEFKVTGAAEFTAVYNEAIIYSAADLNDEDITVGVTGGTDKGTKFYADEYRHEYLRMYDNTTGTAH